MGGFAMAATMDAMAAATLAAGLAKNAYAWPVDSVTVPCVVVGYPTDITFDLTFKRGGDEAVIPLWFVVGRSFDKATRDALSAIVADASSIKSALDGNLGGVVSSLRVVDCKVEEIVINAVSYLGARFTCEVLS